MIAALLGSATTVSVLNITLPASAITWKIDNPLSLYGTYSVTSASISGGSFIFGQTNGNINGSSSVTGSFEFDGVNVTPINVKATITGLTNIPNLPSGKREITFNTASYSAVNNRVSFGVSPALGAPVTALGLTLNFVPGLTTNDGDTTTVSGGYIETGTFANATSGYSYSINGTVAPGTATSVPWETDSLPLIGSTILFGAGIRLRSKLAKNKKISQSPQVDKKLTE